MLEFLVKLFLFWVRIVDQYDDLKLDENSEKRVILGVISLILSILGIGLTIVFSVLAYYCFTVDGLAVIVTFIFGIFCAFAAITCFLQMVLAAVVYAIFQMKLNKRAIGKVALAVSLIILVATIAGVIVGITVFEF